MTNLSSLLRDKIRLDHDVVHPEFFRIYNASDREKFIALLEEKPGIQVFDEIKGQVKELIRLLNPSQKFNQEELESIAEQHIGSFSWEEYGVWVYYPWSNRVVHILDEKEFIESRTNRNMYKITPRERDELAKKKVGVVGLSVGQSAALTLAMERSFGELRIADFDRLELTNMNRIRSGLENLNIPKVVMVAREIMEIDPFLKLTIYGEGITDSNIDRFLTSNGKLDLLVEECDDIYVKFQIRHLCKSLRIPVLMETSDQGMVDVERFDLEPERPIFHGRLKGMQIDLNHIRSLKTSEEKVPYVDAILDLSKRSTRLKASVLEIESSILTWPQLASEVTVGGGMVGEIAKKVMLKKEEVNSGRLCLEINRHLEYTHQSDFKGLDKKVVAKETFRNQAASYAKTQGRSGKVFPGIWEVEELIRVANLAASGGNMQPWLWFVSDNMLILGYELNSRQSMLDYLRKGTLFALGAAIRNLEIASEKSGWRAMVKFLDKSRETGLCAEIRFEKLVHVCKYESLFNYVEARHTNRNRAIVAVDRLSQVFRAIEHVQDDMIHVKFIKEKELKLQIANAVSQSEKHRFVHECSRIELLEEIRWSPSEVSESKDGIDVETLGISSSALVGLKLLRDEGVSSFLSDQLGSSMLGKLENDIRDDLNVLNEYIVFSVINDSEEVLFKLGSVVEELWIRLNGLGLCVQPLSASLFLSRIPLSSGLLNEQDMRIFSELNHAFKEYENLEGEPYFLLRVFRGSDCARSLRRDMQDSIVMKNGVSHSTKSFCQ